MKAIYEITYKDKKNPEITTDVRRWVGVASTAGILKVARDAANAAEKYEFLASVVSVVTEKL